MDHSKSVPRSVDLERFYCICIYINRCEVKVRGGRGNNIGLKQSTRSFDLRQLPEVPHFALVVINTKITLEIIPSFISDSRTVNHKQMSNTLGKNTVFKAA